MAPSWLRHARARAIPGASAKWLPSSAWLTTHVAEWGLWVGRPLLGQWVWDIIRWLDFVVERPIVLVGLGAMGLPAILAAALDHRVAGVVCTECLVSFVGRTTRPWTGVPMGLIAPNILDVGDVAQLAGLVAPRPMVIGRGIEPEGEIASKGRLDEAFTFTRSVYSLLSAADKLALGRCTRSPSPVLVQLEYRRPGNRIDGRSKPRFSWTIEVFPAQPHRFCRSYKNERSERAKFSQDLTRQGFCR